ncbi:Uncharacterised protein [Mycobacteroides abscessus subsp. abscessus]|nr:Uncharacterised protein [Mycobacteroides abscessus subsp. abscessus]SKV19562.1 Uncharacterised protein [Mycobacteroides abscessus subsp. abscessus]
MTGESLRRPVSQPQFQVVAVRTDQTDAAFYFRRAFRHQSGLQGIRQMLDRQPCLDPLDTAAVRDIRGA